MIPTERDIANDLRHPNELSLNLIVKNINADLVLEVRISIKPCVVNCLKFKNKS